MQSGRPSTLLVVDILIIVYFITSELGRYFWRPGIAISGFGMNGDIEKLLRIKATWAIGHASILLCVLSI